MITDNSKNPMMVFLKRRERGKKGEKRFVQNAMSIGAYIGCVKSW